MIKRILLSALLAGAWVLSGAGAAQADPFAMHTELRNFCCTDWTDRTATPTPAPNPGGGAFAFIGGVARQGATVARTVDQTLTTAPFDVAVPASRVGVHFAVTGFPHPNPLFDALTLGVSIDNDAGVLSAGGGPGSFEWCPDAVGPAALACAAPLSATGGVSSLPFHGRIAVTAGPNQFGGAMGWLGSGLVGVINSRNAAGAAATLFTARNFVVPFDIIGDNAGPANPTGTPAGIIARGTQMELDSFYATSLHWQDPSAVPLSVATGSGAASGHVWTTGMVTVSITAGNVPPFQAVTITGSDNRATTGPNIGSGNLTIVSGNLYQDLGLSIPQVRGTTLRMNLPEPTTGMTVAAGGLALMLIGVTRRRKV